MSDKFTLEIISPEGTILKVEASEVVIPSYEGEMGILKNHIPLITFLRPGFIKIKGNEETIFFVEEGTVEFVNNNLLILTSTAKELSAIDQSSIQKQITEAEKNLNYAFKIDEEDIFSLFVLGKMKREQFKLEESVTIFKKICEKNLHQSLKINSFAVKNLTNCGTGGAKGRDLFCGSKEDQEVAKRIDLLLLMRSNTAVLNTGM